MAKRFLVFLLFLLTLTPIFAYTDYFKDMMEDPLYLEVISAVKNNKGEAELLTAYENFVNSEDTTEIEKARIEYHMIRYYHDMGDDDTAREHMAKMESMISSLPPDTTEFERMVAETELGNLEYYISGKLGDGLKGSNLTKELYKKYPDDIFSVQGEVWRLIYTPSIAGGSTRKAISIIDDVMKNYKDQLTELDYYSFICAYALAYNRRDNYEKAKDYFEEAFTYYPEEANIVEEYNKNEKALKKSKN